MTRNRCPYCCKPMYREMRKDGMWRVCRNPSCRYVNSERSPTDWNNLVESTGRKLLREFKRDLEE